jgi:hypothetical protein
MPAFLHVQRHGGMQGFDPEMPVYMRMENGNITVSGNPFRVPEEPAEIKFIYDPYDAVSTACANDCPYGRIVKHGLEIFSPLSVTSRQLVLPVENIRPKDHFEPPFLEQFHSRVDLFEGYASCRGKDGDFISSFQVRGLNHNNKIKQLIRIFAGFKTDYGKTGV